MELQVNNKKLFKVDIFPTTTISQLKQTIKGVMVSQKYNKDDYTVRLIFNNGEELSQLVFNTNTYDNANFQSYEKKIQGGQIYINTPVKVVETKKVKGVPILKVPRPDITKTTYSNISNLGPVIVKEYEKALRNQFLFQVIEDLIHSNTGEFLFDEGTQEEIVADNLAREFEENGYYVMREESGRHIAYIVYIDRPLDISSSSSSSSLDPEMLAGLRRFNSSLPFSGPRFGVMSQTDIPNRLASTYILNRLNDGPIPPQVDQVQFESSDFSPEVRDVPGGWAEQELKRLVNDYNKLASGR